LSQRATSFEIYVLQRGRWELHARLSSLEREAAVEEAHALENLPNIEAVRVVREVYDARTGKSAEYTVYKTASGTKKFPDFGGGQGYGQTSARSGGGGNSVSDWDDDLFNEPDRKRKKRGTRLNSSVVTKLLILALVSFSIALVVTFMFTFAIEEFAFLRRFIGRSDYTDIQVGITLVTFTLSMASSVYAFISKDDLSGEDEVKRFELEERRLFKEALKPRYEIPKKSVSSAPKKSAPKAPPKPKKETEEKAAPQAEVAPPPSPAEPAPALEAPALEAPATTDMADAPPDDVAEAGTDEKDESDYLEELELPISVKAEQQKVAVMSFLSKGLETIKARRPKLDAFNKFGVNLYLAGACEVIAQNEGLTERESVKILSDGVEILGTRKEQATRFASNVDSYLLDPKHLAMIDAGREAMTLQINGDETAPAMLDDALENWNKRNDENVAVGTIAVMFTDIVGSTDMTQTHGDAAAQEVVRTHNRIVRAALNTYHGREVKHTGDGIMASFLNPSDAVSAAIYIQRIVAQNNATNPEMPLGLKIGINAGTPIVEDNDLFGTTVQLAARIVDKATNYQILVSEAVRDLCLEKPHQFLDRGSREMKGFREPIPLFEAVWADDSDNVTSQPTAQAPAS